MRKERQRYFGRSSSYSFSRVKEREALGQCENLLLAVLGCTNKTCVFEGDDLRLPRACLVLRQLGRRVLADG